MPHISSYKALLVGTGLSLAALSPALAQTKTPKYSNEFLNVGVGARALGMGKVQVSLADDATAGYWNPAGLVSQKNKYDGVLMHSELFSGIVKNDYAGFGMKLDDKSALGVSLIRLGVDDIADTRDLVNEYGYVQYDRIRYFSVADYALLLSYARQIGSIEGLQVGANAKVIYRNIGSFADAVGFGIDAGVQYRRNGWQLGLMARDITTTYNAWTIHRDQFEGAANAIALDNIPENSTEITLPLFVFGGSRRFQLPGEFTALAALDMELSTDGQRNTLVSSKAVNLDPRAGLELGYKNLVYLRGGVGNAQQVQSFTGSETWQVQPSLGLGLALNGLRLDMALTRLAVEKIGQRSQPTSIIVSLGYGLK